MPVLQLTLSGRGRVNGGLARRRCRDAGEIQNPLTRIALHDGVVADDEVVHLRPQADMTDGAMAIDRLGHGDALPRLQDAVEECRDCRPISGVSASRSRTVWWRAARRAETSASMAARSRARPPRPFSTPPLPLSRGDEIVGFDHVDDDQLLDAADVACAAVI